MRKQKLQKFISKYYLNGVVPSIVMEGGDSLTAKFISLDRTMIGDISMDGWGLDKTTFAILDTNKLLGMLNVMNDEIDISFKRSNEKAVQLTLKDLGEEVGAGTDFVLADTSIMYKVPDMKREPTYTLKVKLNAYFMDKFVRGKNWLSDVDSFTVLTTGDEVSIVIGYSELNTHRFKIKVETDEYVDVPKMSFSAGIFKEIILANKDCDSAILEVSPEGALRIEFNTDGYRVKYVLVSTNNG